MFDPKERSLNKDAWQGFSAFQNETASRSLEQCHVPTPIGLNSTFRIQQIGESRDSDRADSMVRFAKALWSQPELGEINIDLPNITISRNELPAIRPQQNGSSAAEAIAEGLFQRLCNPAADPVWLAVEDDTDLPAITEALTKAFQKDPSPIPTSVLIGSGRATVMLNALAHTVGLTTFIGCEPRGGHAGTGTFMSTEASRANLVWRCGPDYREQRIALVGEGNQILRANSTQRLITGRLFGGDVVRFDEFLSRYGTSGLRVPYILALESTGVEQGELKRTISRWGRERGDVLSNAQAILIGKVNYKIGGNDEQECVAKLLAENISNSAPIICTDIFGHKTVPYFLPIGGLIDLTVDPSNATMTIPVSVKSSPPRT